MSASKIILYKDSSMRITHIDRGVWENPQSRSQSVMVKRLKGAGWRPLLENESVTVNGVNSKYELKPKTKKVKAASESGGKDKSEGEE